MSNIKDIYIDIDPKVTLDDKQVECVTDTSKVLQVIAGAGSGKTATVVAKVRYLTEPHWGCKETVEPGEILVMSYTKKSTDDIKKKLGLIEEERLKNQPIINADVRTIHSLAYSIIKNDRDANLENEFEIENYPEKYLGDFIDENVYTKEIISDDFIQFFDEYFRIPRGADKTKTLKEIANDAQGYIEEDFDIDEIIKRGIIPKNDEYRTLNNEYLRSHQEVLIANFLYLYGIDYKYEDRYIYNGKPHKFPGSDKPYTPDFHLKNDFYLEHWSVSSDEDHKYSKWSKNEPKKHDEYVQQMKSKQKFHKEKGTHLLETFSSYTDRKSLWDHLKSDLLVELRKHGFNPERRSKKEVFDKIADFQNTKYYDRFKDLLKTFIENYKRDNTSDFIRPSFEELKAAAKNDKRTEAFLTFAEEAFNYYQNKLQEDDKKDFSDLVIEANKVLESGKTPCTYKWIIVDEFQDIAKSRFDLIRFLTLNTEANIMVVGDDWQSIYEFAGSDLTLFYDFLDKMGVCANEKEHNIKKLEMTHRNSKQLIKVAEHFVKKDMKDPLFEKNMKSENSCEKPIIIRGFDDSDKKSKNDKMAEALENTIGEITEKEPKANILVLARYNFIFDNLCRDKTDNGKSEDSKVSEKMRFSKRCEKDDKGNESYFLKSPKYPDVNLEIMTVHKSKGLDRDYVIVLDVADDKFGFPCKRETDSVLQLIRNWGKPDEENKDEIEYAEERRLFYVALTRTKNKVYLLTPKNNPSSFIKELTEMKSDDIVTENIDTDMQDTASEDDLKCPKCGSRLEYRIDRHYYNVGKKDREKLFYDWYECANDKKLCGYKTYGFYNKNIELIREKMQDEIKNNQYSDIALKTEEEYTIVFKKDSIHCIAAFTDASKCYKNKCGGLIRFYCPLHEKKSNDEYCEKCKQTDKCKGFCLTPYYGPHNHSCERKIDNTTIEKIHLN